MFGHISTAVLDSSVKVQKRNLRKRNETPILAIFKKSSIEVKEGSENLRIFGNILAVILARKEKFV